MFKCVLKVILYEWTPAQHGEVLLCPESLLNSWLYGYHGNSPGSESSFVAYRSVFDSSLRVGEILIFVIWKVLFPGYGKPFQIN